MAIEPQHIQAQIDSITNQLVQKYKAEKVILFGSAARGDMTLDSDLDFLIIKPGNKRSHDRVVEIYNLLDKDVAADFLVYTPQEFAQRKSLGDPFIKAILSEGKVLYG